jgi:hypothetical protein
MHVSDLAPPLDGAVSSAVDSYYNEHCNNHNAQDIQPCDISKLIDKLRHNASPGIDLTTAEHLQHLYTMLYYPIVMFHLHLLMALLCLF